MMKTWRTGICPAHHRWRRSCTTLAVLLFALTVGATPAWADNGVNVVSAKNALLADLQGRGLVPADEAGLDLEDYIDVDKVEYQDESPASALLVLRFRPDGHMLPSKQWMARNASYCKIRSRESSKPSRTVSVKIVRTSETAPIEKISGMEGENKLVTRYNYSVFARESDIVDGDLHVRSAYDVETTVAYTRDVGKAKGNNPDTSELDGLVSEALEGLEGLDASIGSPAGPCGEKIEETGAIQPKDGTWMVTMKSMDASSCSPMIAKQLGPALQSMIGDNNRHDLEFDKPFHPRPMMEKGPDLDWSQTGLNTWHALQAESGSSSTIFDVNLDIEVMSETHITGLQKQHVRGPAQLKRLLGTSFDCDVSAVFDYRLVE